MKAVFKNGSMVGEYYSIVDLADALGINRNTMWFHVHKYHRFPAPVRVAGQKRKYYTAETFRAIVAAEKAVA